MAPLRRRWGACRGQRGRACWCAHLLLVLLLAVAVLRDLESREWRRGARGGVQAGAGLDAVQKRLEKAI